MVQVGDHVVVDGGMVTLDVLEKAGPDVRCQVADPGIILSRANLTFRRNGTIVRARNSMLPVLSSKVCASLSLHTMHHQDCSHHCSTPLMLLFSEAAFRQLCYRFVYKSIAFMLISLAWPQRPLLMIIM